MWSGSRACSPPPGLGSVWGSVPGTDPRNQHHASSQLCSLQSPRDLPGAWCPGEEQVTQLGFQKRPLPSCWMRPPGSCPCKLVSHLVGRTHDARESPSPGDEAPRGVHWLNPLTSREP